MEWENKTKKSWKKSNNRQRRRPNELDRTGGSVAKNACPFTYGVTWLLRGRKRVRSAPLSIPLRRRYLLSTTHISSAPLTVPRDQQRVSLYCVRTLYTMRAKIAVTKNRTTKEHRSSKTRWRRAFSAVIAN